MWLTGLGANAARVLSALERVDTPLSGRAIARITGLSQSTSQRTLTELRNVGIVLAEPAPPALLYRINKAHLARPGLNALLHLDEDLRSRLAEHLEKWERRPVSAIIYGSVARGEATPDSDLDLLMVRPDRISAEDPVWQRQLETLSEDVGRWSGRRLSIIEMAGEEVAQGLSNEEPYLVEAAEDGWLVAGRPLRKLDGRRR